jgi:cyclo(L-tyrosyl-L-tyrosyl) synthase
VYETFEDSADFRDACLDATAAYLRAHTLRGDLPWHERLDLARNYFLNEVPVFLDTPGILGVGTSMYGYHLLTPFQHRLYDGDFVLKPAAGQGRLVLAERAAGTRLR